VVNKVSYVAVKENVTRSGKTRFVAVSQCKDDSRELWVFDTTVPVKTNVQLIMLVHLTDN